MIVAIGPVMLWTPLRRGAPRALVGRQFERALQPVEHFPGARDDEDAFALAPGHRGDVDRFGVAIAEVDLVAALARDSRCKRHLHPRRLDASRGIVRALA